MAQGPLEISAAHLPRLHSLSHSYSHCQLLSNMQKRKGKKWFLFSSFLCKTIIQGKKLILARTLHPVSIFSRWEQVFRDRQRQGSPVSQPQDRVESPAEMEMDSPIETPLLGEVPVQHGTVEWLSLCFIYHRVLIKQHFKRNQFKIENKIKIIIYSSQSWSPLYTNENASKY